MAPVREAPTPIEALLRQRCPKRDTENPDFLGKAIIEPPLRERKVRKRYLLKINYRMLRCVAIGTLLHCVWTIRHSLRISDISVSTLEMIPPRL
jgi:hypothetical protein